MRPSLAGLALVAAAAACGPAGTTTTQAPAPDTREPIERLLAKYATVRLTTDLSALTPREREMLPLLIEAAKPMDEIYWYQAYGSRDSLLASLEDPRLRRYAEINYGPWDRLANDSPFVAGVGRKPPGANLYPHDMTKEEFERAAAADSATGEQLESLYTLVVRAPGGGLVAVPYARAFEPQNRRAAEQLRAAAKLAESAALRLYLELRADALLTDEYRASDFAWLDMKDNTLDIVIGPIETYEDQLFGYKTANEAYVLVKDQDWSRRLARYVALLPDLQRGLPVPEEYRRETPGTESDLNAYDVVYYSGQANAGSKTIAINLPNDEEVQLRKGTRRLQLKNAMRAKFDSILVPIADLLIASDQREHVTFDAFFENVMFHEVAHGLGIKNTLNGRGTVREALKEQAGSLEEGKADILGLHMIVALAGMGELGEHDLDDNYVSFLASIFRSVRFGGSSAHGRANVAAFNYLHERGAFARDDATGRWRVDPVRMRQATDALAGHILRLQGDGDYAGVVAFAERYGGIGPELRGDLDRLAQRGIPVDIVFEQGMSVLGTP